jgi:hypothetical protein
VGRESCLDVLEKTKICYLYRRKKEVDKGWEDEEEDLSSYQVKFTLEQVTKAQKGSRCIALLFP